MSDGAINDFISCHSHYPPLEVSGKPGYVVDVETGLQDVIDVLCVHPARRRYAYGLKIFHRKLDLRTELNGHYVAFIKSIDGLAFGKLSKIAELAILSSSIISSSSINCPPD